MEVEVAVRDHLVVIYVDRRRVGSFIKRSDDEVLVARTEPVKVVEDPACEEWLAAA